MSADPDVLSVDQSEDETNPFRQMRQRLREVTRDLRERDAQVESLIATVETLRGPAVRGFAAEAGVTDPRHLLLVEKLLDDAEVTPATVEAVVDEYAALLAPHRLAEGAEGADDGHT